MLWSRDERNSLCLEKRPSSVVGKAEQQTIPSPRDEGCTWGMLGFWVIGEGYQPMLGPEGRLPGGGDLQSMSGRASKSRPEEKERREFKAGGTGRQRLTGKKEQGQFGFGVQLIANTRVGYGSQESSRKTGRDVKGGQKGNAFVLRVT